MSGLILQYQGSLGYLKQDERQAIRNWLKQKNYWNLVELQQHIKATYGVMFTSKQSYVGVKVTVDPRSQEVFLDQPQIVPGNRVAVPAP